MNLIENLIGTGEVAAANEAIEPILDLVRHALADEIATVTANQAHLDRAMREGSFAPEGDEDIYTDEFCRGYWFSYYESYVARSERYHGDRLLLRKFVQWVETVQDDVDVILDFGSLCAQPLFEAALAVPNVRIVGTEQDRGISRLQPRPIRNRTWTAVRNYCIGAAEGRALQDLLL